MNQNKHSLSRYIDSASKQAVRQHCGFGCVICGCAIVIYHHFDPEFRDATSHDPKGITLLCGQCHQRVHAGIIPSEAVKEANNAPHCRRSGHTKDFLFMGVSVVPVRLGSSRIRAESILKYDDEVIMGFSPPECGGAPIRLHADLTDDEGGPILSIVDNEWRVGADNYDVFTKGKVLTVKNKDAEDILKMELVGQTEIQIKKLQMNFRGFHIEADETWFSIRYQQGGTFRHSGEVIGDIGIWMQSDGGALIAANKSGGAAVQLAGTKKE